MLVAALSANGPEGAREIIERTSGTSGRPTFSLGLGGATVAAWDGPGGVREGGDHRWVAEGCVEMDAAELSPSSLGSAKGDFALFALRDDGVLLASARGGGHRAIFVVAPSRDLVVACTHLSPLLALLPEPSPLDRDYLCAFVLGYPPPAEATPYSNVRRVPPREAWLIGPGAAPHRWSTSSALLDPELRDGGQLALDLRHAIEDAVRRAARGAKRVGVEVSGGLDSSMIFSLAASLVRSGEIPAGPEGIACEYAAPLWNDDRPYLRSLEDHLGLRVRRVEAGQAAAFARRPMAIDAMPNPWPTFLAIQAMGTIARARGVDVVLTGDGGDEVLDGNPSVFGALARRGEIVRALKGALRTRGVFYHGPLGRLARFVLRPLAQPYVPKPARLAFRRIRRRLPRWAGPALLRGISDAPASDPPMLTESPGERYARVLRPSVLAWWSLVRHQQEVLNGYAVRAPLLDDDFLRFAATLPPLSLLQGGYLRGLMREAMRGLVPEDLRLRETKGAWCWFVEQTLEKAGGLSVFADLVDVRMLADLGLVEPRAFKAVFNEARERPAAADYEELWRVLSLEAFVREYAGDQATRAA